MHKVYVPGDALYIRMMLRTEAVTLRFLSCRVGMVKLIKVGIVAFERT